MKSWRRTGSRFAVIVTAALLASHCERGREPLAPAWHAFAERFVEAGRVVDRDNGAVSHSEGQGYGMLFAVASGDRDGFDRLWRWSQRVLRRPDGLFSWRYAPCPTRDRACVDDPNNASDGDLLIAWALLRAGERWDEPAYTRQALSIAAAIAGALLREDHGYLFLLPGAEGFEERTAAGTRYRLNLSYYVFPALRDLAARTGDPRWTRLADDGERLLRRARFGERGLHPDWLYLGADGPALGDDAVYGYNACRIPLHVVWAVSRAATLLAPYRAFWAGAQPPPATLDLVSGEPAAYGWDAGMAGIARTVRWRLGDAPPPAPVGAGEVRDADGYYAASLLLLSGLARQDLAP